MHFGPIYSEYFSAVYYGLTLSKFSLSMPSIQKDRSIGICLNVGVVVLAVVGVVVVGTSGTLNCDVIK